MIFQVILQVH